METESDYVISSDSWNKYGLNERCRESQERVQDSLDRGLMSQADVYRRYTEWLSEKLTSSKRSDQPTVIEDIRRSFRRLQDPDNGYLSETAFEQLIEQRLSELGASNSSNASALLFKLCASHAFYPFPVSYSDSGRPQINEDGFVRAISLLTLSPVRRYGPKFSAPVHRLVGGKWGPHRGSYVALRGRNASDFRRRLFRSLAIPDSSSVRTSHETKIPVARFVWFEADEGERTDSGNESEREVFVTEDESERSIDILDVLSECPPEVDSLTSNPFRESYALVLPSLPKHTHEISSLLIPKAECDALVKLVHEVEREDSADSETADGSLGDEENISWGTFDSAMSGNPVSHIGPFCKPSHQITYEQECLADGLSKIFSACFVV